MNQATKESASAELSGCPFCGGAGLEAAQGDDTELYSVWCSGCSAEGPRCDTKELAEAAWNRRAEYSRGVPGQLVGYQVRQKGAEWPVGRFEPGEVRVTDEMERRALWTPPADFIGWKVDSDEQG